MDNAAQGRFVDRKYISFHVTLHASLVATRVVVLTCSRHSPAAQPRRHNRHGRNVNFHFPPMFKNPNIENNTIRYAALRPHMKLPQSYPVGALIGCVNVRFPRSTSVVESSQTAALHRALSSSLVYTRRWLTSSPLKSTI